MISKSSATDVFYHKAFIFFPNTWSAWVLTTDVTNTLLDAVLTMSCNIYMVFNYARRLQSRLWFLVQLLFFPASKAVCERSSCCYSSQVGPLEFIGVDFGGARARAPNNWESPMRLSLFTTFCPNILVCPPKIFDKSTPVLWILQKKSLSNMNSTWGLSTN